MVAMNFPDLVISPMQPPMPELLSLTIRSAVAPILSDARISASLTSQALYGETVQVLEQQGDWVHVQQFDGYRGWTHVGYTMPSRGDEATWNLSLGCAIVRSNGSTLALPLGAMVSPESTVANGTVISREEQRVRFPLTGAAIAHSAETLFAGASYLWGGVSPWGCDCSGFVQRIFALHGMVMPRDAWQQANVGTLVSQQALEDYEVGNLLFFSDRDDGRITHVGIAVGGQRMVHSALRRGGIAIEGLGEKEQYVERIVAQCVGVRAIVAE